MRIRILGLWLWLTAFACFAEPMEVVTEDFPPYNFMQNGVIAGKSTAIVKAVLNRAHLDFTLNLYPWDRAYTIALNKPNVLIYTLSRTPAREKQFKWVRPVGAGSSMWLYRLKDSRFKSPDSLSAAKNFFIGCPSPDGAECATLKFMGFPHFDTPPSTASLLAMLFAHRFQLVLINKATIARELGLQGHSMAQIEPVLEVFHPLPYLALSGTTSDTTLWQLRQAFDDLQREGKIKPVN